MPCCESCYKDGRLEVVYTERMRRTIPADAALSWLLREDLMYSSLLSEQLQHLCRESAPSLPLMSTYQS